jgi:uncharacterized protein with von Willebrand factor type A (vWA) domain
LSPAGQPPFAGGGALAGNVFAFGRFLRAAGLPVGPGHLLTALEAVEAAGVGHREDFKAALQATLVHRQDQLGLFEEAFALFFRDPFGRDQALSMLLPSSRVPEDASRESATQRLLDAMHGLRPPAAPPPPQPEAQERVDFDAAFTWSRDEALRTKDFDAMSAEELRRARRAIARMTLPRLAVPTRRLQAAARGPRLDLRRTLRRSLRGGGADLPLAFSRRRERPPPLVVLLDVSGSMDRYSRMFLLFLHTLTSDRDRVYSFAFGTRLTPVTRWLRHRDVDVALRRVGREVQDWSGGTRIGASLAEFNRRWSRRVLSQGAVVLLVTDGLDREPELGLGREAERLAKSCRRLIWLNPLLRFEGFEPRAAGVRALLPHCHEVRAVHSLASLEDLARALGDRPRERGQPRARLK